MTKKKDLPEYINRIGQRLRGKLPPGVWVADVFHDESCGIWKGLPCSCNPEIGEPIPVVLPEDEGTFN